MVMHEAGQPSKPSRGSTDVTAPSIMNANEASRRPGVNLAGESLDIRQASHWRIAAAPEHNHVSLADSLARPGIGIAISEVNDQRRGVFKSVEPVSDIGRIRSSPGKLGIDAGDIDDLRIGGGEPKAHSTIKGARQQLASTFD
jgi:hypothetical protein